MCFRCRFVLMHVLQMLSCLRSVACVADVVWCYCMCSRCCVVYVLLHVLQMLCCSVACVADAVCSRVLLHMC